MQIIRNSIRVIIYNDASRMRFFDFIFKHGIFPKGAGINQDGKCYLLFDIDEYLKIKDKFYIKKQIDIEENLREY